MKPRVLSLTLLAVVGCTGPGFTRLGPPVAPRADQCEIEVLHARPSRPHRIVGTVHCGYDGDPACAEVYSSITLHLLACRLGADAIFDVEEGGRQQWDRVCSSYSNVSPYFCNGYTVVPSRVRTARAIALVWNTGPERDSTLETTTPAPNPAGADPQQHPSPVQPSSRDRSRRHRSR